MRAWTLFAAVSTVWGVPYLFIKIGVDGGVPPVVLAWGRIVLASIVLLGLASRAGALGGLRRRWRYVFAYAVVEVSIPFPLIATGERYVASSLAAIIVAAVPLFVALLAVRFDADERATGAWDDRSLLAHALTSTHHPGRDRDRPSIRITPLGVRWLVHAAQVITGSRNARSVPSRLARGSMLFPCQRPASPEIFSCTSSRNEFARRRAPPAPR